MAHARLPCGLTMEIEDPDETIQAAIARTGSYEPGLSRLFETVVETGDVVYDVGANIGYFSLLAAARGARVEAFEPLPRLAERIRRHARLNHLEALVRVHETALSHRAGEATLYVARRIDDGSHSLVPGVEARAVEPLTVTTATLDGHAAEAGRRPDVVKIDVEGGEALVLDGARQLLDAMAAVWFFETADRLASTLGETACSVIERFLDRGYQVYRIADQPAPVAGIRTAAGEGALANYVAVRPDSPRRRAIELFGRRPLPVRVLRGGCRRLAGLARRIWPGGAAKYD